MRALLAVLLCASPALAQDAAEENIIAMTRAIEDAGCIVTAENGDAVQEASGLDAEETISVIAAMYTDGAVALQADGTMKLTNEACP